MLKERESKSNYLKKSLEDIYFEEKQKQRIEKSRSNVKGKNYNYLKRQEVVISKDRFQ